MTDCKFFEGFDLLLITAKCLVGAFFLSPVDDQLFIYLEVERGRAAT
jgi:hypothetical protein